MKRWQQESKAFECRLSYGTDWTTEICCEKRIEAKQNMEEENFIDRKLSKGAFQIGCQEGRGGRERGS